MPRFVLSILTILLCLSLVACGATPQAAAAQAGPGSDQTQMAPRDLPLALQLALGTFRLEQTDRAVDAAQAGKLLPLWKAVRSLGQSETAAAQESQAVLKQIQQTMTPEQLDAIKAMQLSYEDIATLGQELGVNLGGGRPGNLSPEVQATRQAARQNGQGGGGGGGFGGGPGGFPGGGAPDGGFSPEARQTAMAARGGSFSPSGLGVPTQLLDALIKFLEAKIQ
ncbi:MAG: hypothetical protein AB1894_16365 [Chloroflexota bacterium]